MHRPEIFNIVQCNVSNVLQICIRQKKEPKKKRIVCHLTAAVRRRIHCFTPLGSQPEQRFTPTPLQGASDPAAPPPNPPISFNYKQILGILIQILLLTFCASARLTFRLISCLFTHSSLPSSPSLPPPCSLLSLSSLPPSLLPLV